MHRHRLGVKHGRLLHLAQFPFCPGNEAGVNFGLLVLFEANSFQSFLPDQTETFLDRKPFPNAMSHATSELDLKLARAFRLGVFLQDGAERIAGRGGIHDFRA